ncbi:MAG TPA: quinone-dependent dihydroorotate dehydrogenase [Aeromicrobium sp.]|nr:quinone-dependent dihydroorotate dehydrogenase [Aeromicrobium sp.]
MVYRAFFNLAFSRLDPEKAHTLAFAAIGRLGGAARPLTGRGTYAPRTVMGIEFPNAFGLAAGFDKNALAVTGLLGLGFGHVEIGTVTAQPQPGNPRPRLFRLVQDEAIINRMGFNNDGAEAVAKRLRKLRATKRGRSAVIGVNIGKTKVVPPNEAVRDYVASARLLAPYATYLVVNVSSPNTPGLRTLQAVEELRPLLTAVREAADATALQRVPLLVKIAPDLCDDDVDAIADLTAELRLDGIIATNTTTSRPMSLKTERNEIGAAGAGGLSGPILAERSIEVLRRLRSRLGDRVAIISVGGVSTPDDARERLAAGADLVQAYTGFIYGGPLWPARIARACSD